MFHGVALPNPNSVTGTLTVSSNIQSTAGNLIGVGWVLNRSGVNYGYITDNGDGVFRFYNGAANSFSGIQFGGTTDSFPGLYRDGAGLKVQGAAGGGTAWIRIVATTVAALPAAATAGVGARAFVTDASAALGSATVGTAVTGGGSNKSPVWSDGSNWLYG